MACLQMNVLIEWNELPRDVGQLSQDQRREFSLQILALLLYPPSGKTKDHNSRQRQRIMMLDIMSELSAIEKEQSGAPIHMNGRSSELVRRFMALGGFTLAMNASPARRYRTTKLKDQWVKLCSAFACFDVMSRAERIEDGRTIKSKTGINHARWLVLLNMENFIFPVGQSMQQLGLATRELQFVPHILVAFMRVLPPTKNVPSLDELRSALSERLEDFLAQALALQDFFFRLHVVRNPRDLSKRKMVLLPAFTGLTAPAVMPLSDDEQTILRAYSIIDSKRLNHGTVRMARRCILNNVPIDWPADSATSRKKSTPRPTSGK